MTETKCPLTELPIGYHNKVKEDEQYVALYNLPISEGLEYFFKVPYDAITGAWDDNKWFHRNRHLIRYALLNGLNLFDGDEIINIPLIQQRLSSSIIPHTPKMKLDHLLIYFADQLRSPGDSYQVNFRNPDLLRQLYMVDEEEFQFYKNTLKNDGFIEAIRETTSSVGVSLTFKGLSYLASLEDAGAQSKKCFIAMAFDEKRKGHRAAIVQAITDCGYIPVIVDDRNINSDQTINDHIIAEIRRCKFCISDFTMQRNGVYFEAGFALGLGKPVIYVCEKDDFKNSHFDLKPFQHLIYESAAELRTGLVRKIQAWIQ